MKKPRSSRARHSRFNARSASAMIPLRPPIFSRNSAGFSSCNARAKKPPPSTPSSKRRLLNGSRIAALYASGQIEAGVGAAQELVKRQNARFGESHFDTASAHGTLAVGYARVGRDAEAIREFKSAIPIMMAGSRENADDDATIVAARSQRLQTIVEAYISLLARSPT